MRILKRVLIVIGAIFGVLVVALVGSIVIDSLIGGGRVAALTNTIVPSASGPPVRAYVAKPETPGPHPAVIMVHEFWGLKPEIIGKADALAREGYIVVAPDLFRGNTTDLVPRAILNVLSNPAAQVDDDLDAVYRWLAQQPDVQADRIAAMGFCFGGGTSIRYATQNPDLAATAVFYGTPVTDPERLKAVRGPVLGIFGGADASIPIREVNDFEAGLQTAGVPHQITIYDGQPHAFVTSIDEIRKGGAQGKAWDEFVTFLDQTLQGGTTSRLPNAARVLPTAMHGASHPTDVLHAVNHLHALVIP